MTDVNRSFADRAIEEVAWVLEPLQSLDSPEQLLALLDKLNWELPYEQSVLDGLQGVTDGLTGSDGLIVTIAELTEKVEAFLDADAGESRIAAAFELLAAVGRVLAKLEPLAEAIKTAVEELGATTATINPASLLVLVERLTDYLVVDYLRRRWPRIHAVLRLVGVIEIIEGVDTILWERVPMLFTDPLALALDVYGWGDNISGFDSNKFLHRLQNLLATFSVTAGLYPLPLKTSEGLGYEVSAIELRLPLYCDGQWPTNYVETGISIAPLPGEPAERGLALLPYLSGGVEITERISPRWQMKLTSTIDINDGLGLLFRPPHDLSLRTKLFGELGNVAEGQLKLDLRRVTDKDALFLLFGSQTGMYLGAQGFGVRAGLEPSAQGLELFAEVEINSLTLMIQAPKEDGFLSKLLSGVKVKTVIDLALGYSSVDGVSFRGSGDLHIVIPIHEMVGPLRLEEALIGVDCDDGLRFQLAASFGAELGPLITTVQRFGLTLPVNFPKERNGNLGGIDVGTPRLLLPTGAGIAIDTKAIVGGGFLDFDENNQRYTGALALQLGEIGITAVGIIATKMPDGSEGYSMLVNIGATFNPAIQIYAALTLAGVGGLVGVNRTMETEVLRSGLKKGTLNSILFPDPKTVIANANQIISDMRSVFPAEEGRFVVGPMVKIGWGYPTILTGDIGVFVETPDPVRVVLMGQVEMALPDAEFEIVGIHIDLLGVVDVEKKELSFQASCQGSGMGTFELYGDAAYFMRWGNKSEMALAIGGFHPKFTAPPPRSIFSDLRAIRMNLNYGPMVQLRLGGYLALTPNTLQLGARIEVFVGVVAVDAGISGFLSFDALFYFSPFAFEGGMAGGVSVSVMGFTLADIRVVCTLSGPAPWNVHGKGMVHVLACDIDIGFEIEWGQPTPALPEAIDPWPELERALARPESWGSRLPAEASMVEALLGIEEEPVEGQPVPVVVHPTGTLEVRQNVAPLEVRLDKLGNAPVENYDQFSIVNIQTAVKGAEGTDTLGVDSIDEDFARGQFEYLTNEQKLSLPSFEKLPGGATTRSSNRIAFGEADRSSQALAYESIVIKGNRTTEKAIRPSVATANWSVAQVLASGNAARRGALRGQGHARFASQGEGMVETLEEKYRIVDAKTLKPDETNAYAKFPDAGVSRVQADQALKQYLQRHPEDAGRYVVVAEFEAVIESGEAA